MVILSLFILTFVLLLTIKIGVENSSLIGMILLVGPILATYTVSEHSLKIMVGIFSGI